MRTRKGTLALLLFAAVSCDIDRLEPLPLAVTIEANPATAAPAQEVTFEITAQGGTLLGLLVDFDDGTTREEDLRGARTAAATLRHAYTEPGIYEVTVTVEDASAGTKTATTSVDVR